MKFKELIIYEWYDNIISAFCTNEQGELCYCNLLAQDEAGVEKIYVCIELKYFEKAQQIRSIIDRQSYLEDEVFLQQALNAVSPINESLLIKGVDLSIDNMKTMAYKSNFDWNRNFFSIGDYPKGLSIAAKIDDWWAYFD